jgi:hypothetical protein
MNNPTLLIDILTSLLLTQAYLLARCPCLMSRLIGNKASITTTTTTYILYVYESQLIIILSFVKHHHQSRLFSTAHAYHDTQTASLSPAADVLVHSFLPMKLLINNECWRFKNWTWIS